MSFLPTDSLGNVTTLNNSFTLSTGAYDRAASSLGLFTTGDRFTGTQISSARWTHDDTTAECH